ncbi:hypothetical protein PAPHI01_0891 [Pancytospora philotis]|nr:hypothetical protein PAPHI01_0891 [Pancytospora philotis]
MTTELLMFVACSLVAVWLAARLDAIRARALRGKCFDTAGSPQAEPATDRLLVASLASPAAKYGTVEPPHDCANCFTGLASRLHSITDEEERDTALALLALLMLGVCALHLK